MEIEKLIEICRQRNEIDFLFAITKQIAEADSIGESYQYCPEYTRHKFNNAEKFVVDEDIRARGFDNFYDRYLREGGIRIYELYLWHIGAIKRDELLLPTEP